MLFPGAPSQNRTPTNAAPLIKDRLSMTNSAKLITAMLVVAATAGSALAATVSPPSQGTRDFDTNRAGPINLPSAKALATPKVDLGAVSRGPLDGDALADAYVTVSLNSDGSTEETPVSDTLRAILDRMAGSPGQ
jgi:hypothetical protein